MKAHLLEIVEVAALIAAGCALTISVLGPALRRSARRARAAEQRVEELNTALEQMGSQLAQSGDVETLQAVVRDETSFEAPAADESVEEQPEAIAPETIAVLTAAATAFLHRSVRLRAVSVQAQAASAWSKQGRVVVQGSHNIKIRSRG